MPDSTPATRRAPATRAGVFVLVLAAGFGATARYQRGLEARHAQLREAAIERFRGRAVGAFGDSHVELAVDDSVTWHVVNFATSSEHYVFTLPKLRTFRPRVALVGCWVHSLAPYYEQLLGPVYLSRLELWDSILEPAERAQVRARLDFESRAFAAARGPIPFLGTQLLADIPQPRRGFGAFYEPPHGPEPTRVDSATAARRAGELFGTRGELPSRFQLDHLERILAWGEAEGVEIVLLSTPVHERLRALVPPEFDAAYRQALRELASRHRFRHWDDAALPLPDGDFRDPDHLGPRGARAYTARLVERLEEAGLLARDRGR